jgi:endonuclease YncB( thermonuclease family)
MIPFLIAILLLLSPPALAQQTVSGPARAIDGDTLAIGEERLRLLGIDAPESGQACRDAQGTPYPCGEWARTALAQMIVGQTVTCMVERQDRYRRGLAVCRAGQTDLNAEMVRIGAAVAYIDRRYQALEQEARLARRGIWAGAFERPEDWRRANRSSR